MFDHLRTPNHVPDCSPFKLLNFNSIMVFHRSGKIDPGAQPSVIATLDFSTVGNYNRIMLFNVLNTALNRGNLGSLSVSPIGFSFRPITGKVYCFSEVFPGDRNLLWGIWQIMLFLIKSRNSSSKASNSLVFQQINTISFKLLKSLMKIFLWEHPWEISFLHLQLMLKF